MEAHTLPNLDEMLEGLTPSQSPKQAKDKTDTDAGKEKTADPIGPDDQWNRFMANLNAADETDSSDKESRLVCKIDRDLADSLDDCNIGNRCRSDLVNAIVRTFFDMNISKLIEYRRKKCSLFDNYNPKQS